MKISVEGKPYDLEVLVEFPTACNHSEGGDTIDIHLSVAGVKCERWDPGQSKHVYGEHDFTANAPTFDLALQALFQQIKEVTF